MVHAGAEIANGLMEHPDVKGVTFLSWSKENRKFEKNIKRTYYGVITDTIESNFSFEDLDTLDYEFDTELPQDGDSSVTKEKAEEIERKIKEFYLKAAELSEGLLADIPRVLRKIAKKREGRNIP